VFAIILSYWFMCGFGCIPNGMQLLTLLNKVIFSIR